jgi:hypothetical protein
VDFWLEKDYIRGLWAFGGVLDAELYTLALYQFAKSFALDSRVVHKDILAVLTRDEAIPLGTAEPLDGTDDTLAHSRLLLSLVTVHRA